MHDTRLHNLAERVDESEEDLEVESSADNVDFLQPSIKSFDDFTNKVGGRKYA